MSWDAPYPEWPLPKPKLTIDEVINQIIAQQQPEVQQEAPQTVQELINQIVAQQVPQEVAQPAPQEIEQVVEQIAKQLQQPQQEAMQADMPIPVEAPKASNAVIDKLANQILGQGTTSQWTGQGMGSAEANARDMGKILASIGITDINQFGLIDKPYDAQVNPDGRGGFVDMQGKPVDPSTVTAEQISGEAGTDTIYTTKTTTKAYGNKETGQEVPMTYSERQQGNAWGGTFEGSGNTGYRVQFTPDGKPLFYTTGASSSDVAFYAPIIAAALTPILGPAASALLGPAASTLATSALTGALVGGGTAALTEGDILKGALLGGAGGALTGYLGGGDLAPTEITERQFAIADAKQLAASGIPADQISEILSSSGYNEAIVNRAMEVINPNPVAVSTPVIEPPVSNAVITNAPAETVQVTAPSVTPTPTINEIIASINPPAVTANPFIQPNIEVVGQQAPTQVAPEVVNAVNAAIQANVTSPVETLKVTGQAEKPQTVQEVINAITAATVTTPTPEAVITGERQVTKEPETVTPIVPTLPPATTTPASPATTAPTEEVKPKEEEKKSWTASELAELARLGLLATTIFGAASQDNGPTQYGIVPVPEDWRSPVYQKDILGTNTTPFAPTDYRNRNLLIGTQWEKFLDPNYGKVPEPIKFNQPSGMSYDQLMGILGNSADTMPSQALTINDVISGIQNQYGQIPARSMGQKPT